jgi:uncharacterized membrane protein
VVELGIAVLFMVLSHAVPSAPAVRERLIAKLGRPTFFAAYGALSLAILVWVILAFRRADPSDWVYLPPPGARAVAVLVMPFALFLVVARLMQRPTERPVGVYRITAVPGSLGVLLWSVLHLINLGSVRHILLFGGFATIASIALIKNARMAAAAHHRIGVVPFLAVLRGREQVAFREIVPSLLLGLALYALLLWLHPVVIGVDPLAGAW